MSFRQLEPQGVDYEALDPGIRRLVRLLNEAGFETTDSGDGQSKGEFGEPYAHVHMVLREEANMVDEAHYLLSLVRQWLRDVPADLGIEVSYSPI